MAVSEEPKCRFSLDVDPQGVGALDLGAFGLADLAGLAGFG